MCALTRRRCKSEETLDTENNGEDSDMDESDSEEENKKKRRRKKGKGKNRNFGRGELPLSRKESGQVLRRFVREQDER